MVSPISPFCASLYRLREHTQTLLALVEIAALIAALQFTLPTHCLRSCICKIACADRRLAYQSAADKP